MPARKITTDHETIKKWVEERQGRPTTVRGSGGDGKAGVLRIDFPGHKGTRLETIPWEEFFLKFDEKGLAFLYQETTSLGQPSRFCRFVRRGSIGLEGQGSEKLEGSRPAAQKPEEPRSQPEDEERWEGESPAAARPPGGAAGDDEEPFS